MPPKNPPASANPSSLKEAHRSLAPLQNKNRDATTFSLAPTRYRILEQTWRNTDRTLTCFLRSAVFVGLELIVRMLALQRLGLERLLQAVAHHGRAGVGVGEVRHTRRSPVRRCSLRCRGRCCTRHCACTTPPIGPARTIQRQSRHALRTDSKNERTEELGFQRSTR